MLLRCRSVSQAYRADQVLIGLKCKTGKNMKIREICEKKRGELLPVAVNLQRRVLGYFTNATGSCSQGHRFDVVVIDCVVEHIS